MWTVFVVQNRSVGMRADFSSPTPVSRWSFLWLFREYRGSTLFALPRRIPTCPNSRLRSLDHLLVGMYQWHTVTDAYQASCRRLPELGDLFGRPPYSCKKHGLLGLLIPEVSLTVVNQFRRLNFKQIVAE